MNNPLIMAVDAFDCLTDMECDMMAAISGDAAFDHYDEALGSAIVGLVITSTSACFELSPRARTARLNLIWRSFVETQRNLRSPHDSEVKL